MKAVNDNVRDLAAHMQVVETMIMSGCVCYGDTLVLYTAADGL